jgi:hypothetical protein
VKSMASSGELKTSSIMMVSWEHPSSGELKTSSIMMVSWEHPS